MRREVAQVIRTMLIIKVWLAAGAASCALVAGRSEGVSVHARPDPAL
ncbi:MAG: hypothetical protein GX492_08085 [Firmicutes bacterium]|nr:hypothetical protein [Bacillota bacterium]